MKKRIFAWILTITMLMTSVDVSYAANIDAEAGDMEHETEVETQMEENAAQYETFLPTHESETLQNEEQEQNMAEEDKEAEGENDVIPEENKEAESENDVPPEENKETEGENDVIPEENQEAVGENDALQEENGVQEKTTVSPEENSSEEYVEDSSNNDAAELEEVSPITEPETQQSEAVEIFRDSVIDANVSTPGEQIWYKYTALENEDIVFGSEGSFDTRVYVYDESMGNITEDDDSGSENNFLARITVEAGKVYYFCVSMYSPEETGKFKLLLKSTQTITDFKINEGTIISNKMLYGQTIYEFADDFLFDVAYGEDIQSIGMNEATIYGDYISISEEEVTYDDYGHYQLGMQNFVFSIGGKDIPLQLEVVKGDSLSPVYVSEGLDLTNGTANYGSYILFAFIPEETMRYRVDFSEVISAQVYDDNGESLTYIDSDQAVLYLTKDLPYYFIVNSDEKDTLGMKIQRIPEVQELRFSENSVVMSEFLYGEYEYEIYDKFKFDVLYTGGIVETIGVNEITSFGDTIGIEDVTEGETYDEAGNLALGKHTVKFSVADKELLLDYEVVEGKELDFVQITEGADFVDGNINYGDKYGFFFTANSSGRYNITLSVNSDWCIYTTKAGMLENIYGESYTERLEAGETYYFLVETENVETVGMKIEAIPEVTDFRIQDPSCLKTRLLYGDNPERIVQNARFIVSYGDETEILSLYEETSHGDYVSMYEEGGWDEDGKYTLGTHNIQFTVADKVIPLEIQVVQGSEVGFQELTADQETIEIGYNYGHEIGFYFSPTISQRYKTDLSGYYGLRIIDELGNNLYDSWTNQSVMRFETGKTYYFIINPESNKTAGMKLEGIPEVTDFRIKEGYELPPKMIYGDTKEETIEDVIFEVWYGEELFEISMWGTTKYGDSLKFSEEDIWDEKGNYELGTHNITISVGDKEIVWTVEVAKGEELGFPEVYEGDSYIESSCNYGSEIGFKFSCAETQRYRVSLSESGYIRGFNSTGDRIIDNVGNIFALTLEAGEVYYFIVDTEDTDLVKMNISAIPQITDLRVNDKYVIPDTLIYGHDIYELIRDCKFDVVYDDEEIETIDYNEATKYGDMLHIDYSQDIFDENGKYALGTHQFNIIVGDRTLSLDIQVKALEQMDFPVITEGTPEMSIEKNYGDWVGFIFTPLTDAYYRLSVDSSIFDVFAEDGSMVISAGRETACEFEKGKTYHVLCRDIDGFSVSVMINKIPEITDFSLHSSTLQDTFVYGDNRWEIINYFRFNVSYGSQNETLSQGQLGKYGLSVQYYEDENDIYDENGCYRKGEHKLKFQIGNEVLEHSIYIVDGSELNFPILQEGTGVTLSESKYRELYGFQFTPEQTAKYKFLQTGFQSGNNISFIIDKNGTVDFSNGSVTLNQGETYYIFCWPVNDESGVELSVKQTAELEYMTIDSLPYKTSVLKGDYEYDLTGLTLKVKYKGKEEELVSIDEITSEGEKISYYTDVNEEEGYVLVTLRLEEKTAEIKLDIVAASDMELPLLKENEIASVSRENYLKFVPESTGEYYIEGTYPGWIALYTEGEDGSLVREQYNIKRFSLTAGTTYYFYFSGFNSGFIFIRKVPQIVKMEVTNPGNTMFVHELDDVILNGTEILLTYSDGTTETAVFSGSSTVYLNYDLKLKVEHKDCCEDGPVLNVGKHTLTITATNSSTGVNLVSNDVEIEITDKTKLPLLYDNQEFKFDEAGRKGAQWYRFIPETSGTYYFYGSEGLQVIPETKYASVGGSLGNRVVCTLQAGKTYYIRMHMESIVFERLEGVADIQITKLPTVEKIEITKNPDNIQYSNYPNFMNFISDNLLKGLELTITYDNGEEEEFKNLDWSQEDAYGNLIDINMPSDIYSGDAGKYQISISCGEAATSFEIEVTEYAAAKAFTLESGKSVEINWKEGEGILQGTFTPEISGYYQLEMEGGLYSHYCSVRDDYGYLSNFESVNFVEGKEYTLYYYNNAYLPDNIVAKAIRMPSVKSIEILKQPESSFYILQGLPSPYYILAGMEVRLTYEDGKSYEMSYGEADQYGRYLSCEDITYGDFGDYKFKITLSGDNSGNYAVVTGARGTFKEYSDILNIQEGERVEAPSISKGKIAVFSFTPETSGYYRFTTDETAMVYSNSDELEAINLEDRLEAGHTYYYTVINNSGNMLYGVINKIKEIEKLQMIEMPEKTAYQYGITLKDMTENRKVLEGSRYRITYTDGTNEELNFGENNDYGYRWGYQIQTVSDEQSPLKKGDYRVVVFLGTRPTFFTISITSEEMIESKITLQDISVEENGAFALKWNRVKEADGYEIWRKEGVDGEYERITSVADSTYEDKDTVNGYVYYYQVRAYAENGSGKIYSEFSNIRQIAALDKITWDENGLTRCADGVKLQWIKIRGGSGYKIYRSADGKKYDLLDTVGKTNYYVDEEVEEETQYYYKVRGFNNETDVIYQGEMSTQKSITTWKKPALTVYPASGVTMRLSWTDIDCSAYEVYRSENAGGPYEYVKTTTGTSTSDTGRTAGTRYYYRVCGYKLENGIQQYSLYSDSKAAVALATPSIESVENKADGIMINWSKASGADRYNIYRSETPDGTYEYIQSIVSGNLSYTDTEVDEGDTYYYKVRAYKRVDGVVYYGGYSDYDGCIRMEAPELSVSPSSGVTMKLSWNSIPNAAAYEIYRSESESGEYVFVKATTGNSTSDTGRIAGTRYYYKIRAYRQVNGKKCYTDYSAPKAAVALATPNISSVENKTDGIVVSWSKASGADRYNIYRSETINGKYEYIQSIVSGNLSYTDQDVSTNKTYYYKVRAYKRVDGVVYYGGYSTAGACVRLIAPTLTVYPSSGVTMRLSWTSASGVDAYEIYRSTEENGDYTYVKGTTGLSTSDTGRTAGTRYFYKIRGYKQIGNIKYFTDYSPAVAAVALAQSTIHSVQWNGTGNLLEWSKASGADRYNVYRSETKNEKYEYIQSVLGGETSYLDSTAQEGKTYYYKVRAYKRVDGIVYYGLYSEAVGN